MSWLGLLLFVLAVVYAGLIVAIAIGSRQWDLRLIARLVPHCAVLFKRLLGRPARLHGMEGRVRASRWSISRSRSTSCRTSSRWLGQLDDAIIVALVLRGLLRSAGPRLMREHWPGPTALLVPLERFAGTAPAARGGWRPRR